MKEAGGPKDSIRYAKIYATIKFMYANFTASFRIVEGCNHVEFLKTKYVHRV